MPTDRVKMLLAQLLRGENRANMLPEEAMAIADTALNRTGYQGFPDDLEGVLLQPDQYTPLSVRPDASPAVKANAASTSTFGPSDPLWSQYFKYAEQALDPARVRSEFTHYFSGPPPNWASTMEGLTQIGSHYFGKEKRRKKGGKK